MANGRGDATTRFPDGASLVRKLSRHRYSVFTAVGYRRAVRSRSRLATAVFAVALATCVAVPGAGAGEATKTRTLLTTTKPIHAFAQDKGRVAWVGGKWQVYVRSLGPKPTSFLAGSARPFGVLAPDVLPPQLALAGARVLWTRSGGGNDLETDLYVQKAGNGDRPRLVSIAAGGGATGEGSYFGAVAAAGSTLAYSVVEYQCVFDAQSDCAELALNPFVPGTFTVSGTSGSNRLPAVPTAIELAVSGNRIALVPPVGEVASIPDPASPPFAAPGMTVDVRDATTGALVSRFTPPGTVRALALSGSVAAVVDDAAIERYDPNTGALLGTTDVPGASELAESGHTLVYAVGNRIKAMDATTGTQQVLAVSPGPPIGLSVVGKRVAWAFNANRHGHVAALTLP